MDKKDLHSLLRNLSRLLSVFLWLALFAMGMKAQLPPTGPHIYLQDPQSLPVTYSGSSSAISALTSGQAAPLSVASGDFYQEGISGLAVGYAAPGGGIVTLLRGNLDAFAPQSLQSWQAIAQGQFPSPFPSSASALQIPAPPDFLAAGVFAGSDHQDLVTAARSGSSLYVLAGDGQGHFAAPQVLALSGAVTALAAGDFASHGKFSSLLVGIGGSQPGLLLYRGSAQGLSLIASYTLPAPATAFAFADLDGDSLPDAAIIAGGQVLILHATQGTGQPTMEQLSLPLSASAIALGSFVHDHGWRQQMAILGSDGSVSIVVHGGFDPRGWTQSELQAMRQAVLQKKPNPFVPTPLAPVNDGWKVVETFSGVAPFTDASHPPLFYRARVFDQSAHDIAIINHEAARIVLILHRDTPLGAATFTPGQVSTRAYSSGSAVAGLPMRVNVDGRGGLVVLHQNDVVVKAMMPLPDPTFFVNTQNDPSPGTPANNCNNTSCTDTSSSCSLRQAVMKANADAANNAGPDTIMLCAGTFALTIPSQQTFPGDASSGHLDINGGMTIVGAGPSNTTIVGQKGFAAPDKAFSILGGASFASFSTTFSNLTITSGQAPAADPVGGAFDWDAGVAGTGTLTLTSVNISNSLVVDPTLPSQDDGGGVFLSDGQPVATTATVTGGTIQGNQAGDAGGGIAIIGPVALTMTGTQLQNNKAVGGGAQNGGGLASSNGTAAGSATLHGATLSGNTAGASGMGNGGGIWSQQPLTVDQSSVLQGNQSGNAGGGTWSDVTKGAVSLTTTTMTGNQTGGNGGGIHVEGSGNPFSMTFSRISGNHAVTGSGLHSAAATATATDNWWGCNEGPAPASGTTPVKVFNSGVLAGGGLAADGSTDIHYSLVGSADPTALGPGTVLANSSAFPIPPWMTNGPSSKWIAPLANAGAALNPGTYIYQTTFDLTGFDPTSVALSGQWAADNFGSIDLNGVGVVNSSTSGFTAFAPFTANSGFINGINTMDFVVTNAGSTPNPTGFRAEVSGSGNSTSACDLVAGTATANPWITLTHKPSSSPVLSGSATQLTASFLQDSAGGAISPSNLGVLIGLPVSFSNAVNGALSNAQSTIQSNGTATATLTTNASTVTPSLLAHADATVDKATASAVVQVSDFSLYAAPATQPINVGGIAPAVAYDVTVSSIEGFNGAVALSCTAPAGITVVCNPNTINGAGAATMGVSIAGSVAPGNDQINVQASSGNIQHSATVQLTVADFHIDVTAADGTHNVTVQHGQTANYTVTCSSSTGFSGPVQLSTSIPGASVTFSNNPLNCPGQSALTVVTPTTMPAGVDPFNVTGTYGSASPSGAATLTVTLIPGTPATGSISVYGYSTTVELCNPYCHSQPVTGTVTVTINGTPYQVGYYSNYNEDAGTVAERLKNAINNGSLVTGQVNGSTISLQANTAGSSTNYSMSTDCTSDQNVGCAFTINIVNPMSGGTDPH